MKKMSRFFMFIESIFIKFTSIINKCKKMKYLQPYRFPTRHISTWEILKTKPHKSETARQKSFLLLLHVPYKFMYIAKRSSVFGPSSGSFG